MLTRMQTAELSLVKRGANKKSYAFAKSENAMNPIHAVMSAPAEGEEQFVALMKSAGASEERVEAAVAAYRLQKGFADVLKSEDLAVIAKAAGYKKAAKKGEDDEEESDDEEDDKDDMPFGKKKKAATKKSAEPDFAQLDAATRAQVQAVFKSNEELTQKSANLEGIVKTLLDERTMGEYVAKAKEFSHVPGKPEEIAVLMKSAHDSSPELAKGLEKLLQSMNEIVSKSALLGTIGSSGSGGSSGGSAWAKLEAMADGLVMKSSDGKLSKEQALARVMKSAEGRVLYAEYLGEHPAQRAKVNFA